MVVYFCLYEQNGFGNLLLLSSCDSPCCKSLFTFIASLNSIKSMSCLFLIHSMFLSVFFTKAIMFDQIVCGVTITDCFKHSQN